MKFNKIFFITFICFIFLFNSVFAESTTKPLEFEIFADYYFNSNLVDVFGKSKDGVMTAYNKFNEFLKDNNLVDTFTKEVKNVKNSLTRDEQKISYTLKNGYYDSSGNLLNGARKILKVYSDSFSNIGDVYSKSAKGLGKFIGINQLGNKAKIKEFMGSNSFHIDNLGKFCKSNYKKDLGLSKNFIPADSKYAKDIYYKSCPWYSSLGNGKYIFCWVLNQSSITFYEYDSNADDMNSIFYCYDVINYHKKPLSFDLPMYYFRSDTYPNGLENDNKTINGSLCGFSSQYLNPYDASDFTFGYYFKNNIMYSYCCFYRSRTNTSFSYYGKKDFNLTSPDFKSYSIPGVEKGNFTTNDYTYNFNYYYDFNNINGNTLEDKLNKILSLNDSDREKYLDELLKQKKINEIVESEIGSINDRLKAYDDKLELLDKNYNDISKQLSGLKDDNNNKLNSLGSKVQDVSDKTNSLFDIFGKIKDFFDKFFAPPSKSLNFDSFKNLSLKDKFPFCIPGDFKNILNNLVASEKVPKWDINFLNNSFSIDFSIFSSFSKISKGFCIISYCVGLGFITKKIID